jgi:hypothetical protein
MLRRIRDATRISFGEMKAIGIFSFVFRIARFIDAVLSRGIRSQEIR